MFLDCSYLPMFPNGGLVAWKEKKALRNTSFLLFHPAVCEKPETINTVSANVTSLLITPPAPDGPANSNKSLNTCIISICVQGLFKLLEFV